MENKHQNIDKLFNDAFNGWEADASPLEMKADWNRLSQQLPQAPVNSPAVPKPVWSAGKLAGLVATGAVVTTAGILLYNAFTKNTSNAVVEKAPQQVEVTIADNTNIIAQNDTLQGKTADKDIWAADKKPVDIKSETARNNGSISGDEKVKLPRTQKENPYKAGDKNASGNNNNNASGSNNNNNTKPDVKNDVPVTPQSEKPGISARFNKNSIVYSDTIFCLGKELNVKYNEAAFPENIIIEWGDGKKEIFGGNAQHIYSTPGKYFIQFKANNRNVAQKLVSVEEKPAAEFTVRECDGLKCKFRNTSKNGYIYMWRFGDGSGIERSMNPEHTFSDTGEYKVSLTAYSRGNCEDVYSKTIKVRESNAPTIYTIFNPNGDGYNDVFKIQFKEEVSYFELTVVDRNGARVFETRDPGQSWNGTVQNRGTACPDGSYFYMLSYKYAADGKLKQEQGAVQLKR